MTNISKQLDKALKSPIFVFFVCLCFRKRWTNCEEMFSAVLMLWITKQRRGFPMNTVITCVRCCSLLAFGWREGRGLWAHVGAKFHKNSNKCPAKYQNTYREELMTVICILIDEWRKKLGSSRSGTVQGKRASAWAPLWVHLCTCLLCVYLSGGVVQHFLPGWVHGVPVP